MDARAVLHAMRDRTAGTAEMRWAAAALASGEMSDAQAGAFAMSVVLQGLDEDTRVALTQAMRDSGQVLQWDLPGPIVDKHSTGGIGDCVSLMLAPMLAAAGGYVPMVSGRGLGHTGGTLDKLEAVPGVSTEVDEARFKAIVANLGCAIVAASPTIAPADRRLYAVRDVTSTVESIDLITASILSKKLAAGLESLVLDVKVGSGAFMQSADEARALAESLTKTANGAGCRTRTLITDMNQPLAPAVGNAVEVKEILDVLKGGKGAPRLRDLSVALGGVLAQLSGIAEDEDIGQAAMIGTLESGAAAEVFEKMIAELGGPRRVLDGHSLPEAPVIRAVDAPKSGVVSAINGIAMGEAVVHLGGGRMVQSDRIDPRVGVADVVELGTSVSKGDPMAMVHAANETQAEAAAAAVLKAVTIGSKAENPPLIHGRVE